MSFLDKGKPKFDFPWYAHIFQPESSESSVVSIIHPASGDDFQALGPLVSNFDPLLRDFDKVLLDLAATEVYKYSRHASPKVSRLNSIYYFRL